MGIRIIVTLLLALTAVFAEAQQAAKVPRIGFLGTTPLADTFKSFQQGLRELGYTEGQTILVESRFDNGNNWHRTEFAIELVRLKVDVIVTQYVNAVRQLSKTIPVVMVYAGDPVTAGIVENLEQPGNNITGIGGLSTTMGGKWLEILKETVPAVNRVGVLYTPIAERDLPLMKELEIAAHFLQIELQPAQAGSSSRANWSRPFGRQVGSAFAWATRQHADALIVLPADVFDQQGQYLVNLAVERRIPSIFSRATFAQMGGFLAYGPNRAEQFRRAAYYVDKILKGAKPAELPIELPKKFDLVINLKTAKEIGITVPPRVLAWADKVIK